jgi:catechol 2,3-dioxygenase-like lactoylglutathione lyase family enzyme
MRLYRVILPVADIDITARFYSAAGERVSPGRHYFDCEGVVLACYDAAADGDEPGEARALLEPLYFAVDDLESVRARCVDAGAVFKETQIQGVGAPGRIEMRPWGERSFYTEDPFGNTLCFVDRASVFIGADRKEAK